MTVTRHRHIHDIRFDLAQLGVTQAPSLQDPRAEVLDDDVGDGDQSLGDLEAHGAAHIKAEALLVDIRIVEVAGSIQIDLEALRRGGAGEPAALVLWPLDFDDLGSQGAKPASGPRPRPHPAEVHHANTIKGSTSRHVRSPALRNNRSPSPDGRRIATAYLHG